MEIFFTILLTLAIAAGTWVAIYVVYRLYNDRSSGSR